jgi:hypothetical protein
MSYYEGDTRLYAFPRQHTVADGNDSAFKLGHPGMTLRDYFAGQALGPMVAFLLANPVCDWGALARDAYAAADAMLAAREGTP